MLNSTTLKSDKVSDDNFVSVFSKKDCHGLRRAKPRKDEGGTMDIPVYGGRL
jgi:hypothetical protein